ncbi:uncharacterized protein J8A68_003384 [[Candida] subhashii]|uniref:Uncharacterized protein n=1 Tax=[Candida] subhashii TaxID=561895 RepID=A0A8J5QMQ7_9ASCO|nr:uncharacterized protein J8A68_003384 [[Candida] subhashii]KAG7663112.1 hypothetical protein J8A68_003384 [[Candida] subhashii]
MSPVTRENTRSRSIHTGRRLKLYKLNFLEVSFENASFKSMMHASTPLGKCINNYSKQPATYLQGWAIEAGAAANLKIDFATFIIDLHPTTKVEFGVSVGLSGSFSCDVPPGHPLQFALTSERYEISGVRQRRMRITRFGLQEEEWEEVPTFTKVNTRNIQIACITDPRLVKCPPLVH